MSKNGKMRYIVFVLFTLFLIHSCSKKEPPANDIANPENPVLNVFEFSRDSIKFSVETAKLQVEAVDPEHEGNMELTVSILKGKADLLPTSDVLVIDSTKSGENLYVFRCLQDSFRTELAFSPDTAGEYLLKAYLSSDTRKSDEKQTHLIVYANRPPVADFMTSIRGEVYPKTVVFDASTSYDPDGQITGYQWIFPGDTILQNQPILERQYMTAVSEKVKLTVQDNDGATASIEKSIYLENKKPVASFSFTILGEKFPKRASLDASDSYDEDGKISKYIWIVNGDTILDAGKNLDLSFDSSGVYPVELIVVDEQGLKSDPVQKNLQIVNNPPNANFSYNEIYEKSYPRVFTFDASGSQDDGMIERYVWDFGDGVVLDTNVAVIQHPYSRYGKYMVVLTVYDNEGESVEKSLTIQTKNTAPVVKIRKDGQHTISHTGIPFTYQFSDSNVYDIDHNINSYVWKINDKIIKQYSSPLGTFSHVFDSYGTYQIVLTVKDTEELESSDTLTLNINEIDVNVKIDIQSGSNVGSSPLTIDLVGQILSPQDPNQIDSVAWDFGDDNYFNGLDPEPHTYSQPGEYTVTFFAQSIYGNSDRDTLQILVKNDAPHAIFSISPDSVGAPPFEVTFDASDSYDPNGDGLTYEWDFGDGTVVSNGKVKETHVFDEPGGDGNAEFTVTLTVKDPYNKILASDTYSELIRIHNSLPSGSIHILNNNGSTEGPGPLTLQMEVAAQDPDPGQRLTYHWEILNDNRSKRADLGSDRTVSYTFPIGDYFVVCRISDGYAEIQLDEEIHVTNVAPVAEINPDWNTLIFDGPSHTIEVTDEFCSDANGNIARYEWKLDNQLIATYGPDKRGSFQVEVNGYGVHTLSLTVTDSAWATATDEVEIQIVNRPPTIALHVEPGTSGSHPFQVTFTPVVTDPNGENDIQNIVWNFGDGSDQETYTVIQSVHHTFEEPGTYNVQATVSDRGGNKTTGSITIRVTNDAPKALFTVAPSDNGVPPFEVSFDATSSNDPNGDQLIYNWDFGDGAQIENGSARMTHIFDEPNGDGNAQFTVRLTVKDPYNKIMAEDTYEKVITIRNTVPDPTIRVLNNNGNFEGPYPLDLNMTVEPNDPDQNQTITYKWNIINLQTNMVIATSQEQNFRFTFEKGTYRVECTVSDGYSSVTRTQTVNSLSYAPDVTFHATPGMGEYPLSVQFTESVSDQNGMNDIEIMSLDFGDGTPPVTLAQTQAVSHTYSEPGTYSARFIVRDADNHTVTRTNVIHVINTPPTADIRLTNPSPEYSQPGLPAGSTFRFDASGSNDSRTSDANLTFKYYWNNQLVTQGKGVTTFQYVPDVVGQYSARVEVEDEKQATDSKTIQVYSFNRAPVVHSLTRTPEGTIVYYLGSKIHFNIHASDPDQNTPLNLRVELDYLDDSGNVHHEVIYTGSNTNSLEYTLPDLTPKMGSVTKELNFRFIFADDVSGVPGSEYFRSRSTIREVTVLVRYIGKLRGGSF